MLTHALGYQSKLFPRSIRNTDLYAELKLTEVFNRSTGIWYDPQDLTTLYQDAAGTLPMYRPGTGQVDPPVGLMLDKGQGLEVSSVNVVRNGDFTASTGWTTESGWSIANGIASATAATGALYRGDVRVGKYYEVTYTILNYVSGSVMLLTGTSSSPTVRSANGTYTERIFCLGTAQTRVQPVTPFTGSIDNISVREIKGYHAYQSTTTARPTLSGRYNLLTATATLATQSVTTVATNYTLRFEGTGTITLSGTATGTYSAGTHTITCTAGTLTCTVAGSVTKADLRRVTGQVLPPYQAVVNANTYDTAGFPLFIKRDLTDDKHTLIVPTGGIAGTRLQTTLDAVTTTSETMAAGTFDMFTDPTTGPPAITQWLQFNKALSASELAIAERFSKSRARLV